MPYYTTRDAAQGIYELLQVEKGQLGISYVGYGDEQLIPSYPAVVVTPGALGRALAGTHKFSLRLEVNLWIYHARISQTHKVRTDEDLKLVEELTALMHTSDNMTLTQNVIHGFIEDEIPGVLQTAKGAAVLGTRLIWAGIQRQMF